MERTESEQRFDDLVTARRKTGRTTYGRGLTHTDPYDWRLMALEEALDMGQYLMAEVVRLETALMKVEAAFQFMPAEHVAHLKHKTRADLRVEAKVTYATIGKFPWSAMMMQQLGDREAMHTLRSGCEDSYRVACLAALTAAKELADGE